jgi:hypothetical protein
MAVAFVQEFAIDPKGDRTTTNYDEITARLDAKNDPPEGGILHSAGFDEEAGVFRIFDVWETREHAQRYLDERVIPIVNEVTAGRSDAGPPERSYFYELHDVMTRSP